MRLKYLKGKSIRVNWKGTDEFTLFVPFGNTSDERGQRLLDNPEFKGHFEKVESEPVTGSKETVFKCDVCGFEGKSKAGLAAHKRKHKEIET